MIGFTLAELLWKVEAVFLFFTLNPLQEGMDFPGWIARSRYPEKSLIGDSSADVAVKFRNGA